MCLKRSPSNTPDSLTHKCGIIYLKSKANDKKTINFIKRRLKKHDEHSKSHNIYKQTVRTLLSREDDVSTKVTSIAWFVVINLLPEEMFWCIHVSNAKKLLLTPTLLQIFNFFGFSLDKVSKSVLSTEIIMTENTEWW